MIFIVVFPICHLFTRGSESFVFLYDLFYMETIKVFIQLVDKRFSLFKKKKNIMNHGKHLQIFLLGFNMLITVSIMCCLWNILPFLLFTIE
jgi:hypothetical protein